MDLAEFLRNKGISVQEFENSGNIYREKWLEAFSDGQSRSNFLWEEIPGRIQDHCEGKDANLKFDRIKKPYCILFFQESNDVLQLEFADLLKARDLWNEEGERSDVYVVDKGFNWTYLVPHEQDWGPYYYRRKKK